MTAEELLADVQRAPLSTALMLVETIAEAERAARRESARADLAEREKRRVYREAERDRLSNVKLRAALARVLDLVANRITHSDLPWPREVAAIIDGATEALDENPEAEEPRP